jgi:trans-2,3-dihydro-3-hydroxyanthranilate isomerase
VSKRSYRYVLVDVFTDRPLTGNQLAVFTDARGLPPEQMQALAREMNLAETTFVLPSEGDGHARVRIFTPTSELPFAGHPVLGTAFVLAAPLDLPEVRLEVVAGTIPVTLHRDADGRVSFGWMVQPVPTWKAFDGADELLAAAGLERTEAPVEVYDNGVTHAFVMLGSREQVAALAPDIPRIERVAGVLGVSYFAGAGTSWKTRMFAPAFGVAEDPATGSAAGPLVAHAARHGFAPFGEDVEISQGEELGRPSTLYARIEGNSDRLDRVEVGGSAVIVARGEFRL